jgi:phenylalanyl-tRNA synthetase alpha chain
LRAGVEVSDDVLKGLKNRKLVEQKTMTHYKITKGPAYREQRVKLQPELTSEMITSGEWETQHFKRFNLDALGSELENGNLHPLMKTRT